MKNIKHVLLFVLFAMVVYVLISQSRQEVDGFVGQPGWDLSSSTSYENAHGSAPAGVNALPGEEQYRQNAGSPHVDHANKTGNLQNTNPELKRQPMFQY